MILKSVIGHAKLLSGVELSESKILVYLLCQSEQVVDMAPY